MRLGRETTLHFGLRGFPGGSAVTRFLKKLHAVRGRNRPPVLALAKTEGCSNDEMAAQLECVPRPVVRNLSMIRAIWSHEATA
jgi:hypothetical protein